MQSRLDPNVSPVARYAEASDSRMAIRQHEEQPHKKRDEPEKEELILPEDSYDQAVVGVRPLIDFLQNFLKSADTASHAEQTPSTPTIQKTEIHPIDPATSIAARAASAYQHTARTRLSGQPLQTDAGNASAAQALLSNTEVRQIHDLITKLNTLENHSITTLKLEKAERFLDSLMLAADQAIGISITNR
jgi:hypothetical protein